MQIFFLESLSGTITLADAAKILNPWCVNTQNVENPLVRICADDFYDKLEGTLTSSLFTIPRLSLCEFVSVLA
jgi:hypothetical protein